jgi:hypothetical protein
MNIIESMCCNEVESFYVRDVLVSRHSQILEFNGINQSYENVYTQFTCSATEVYLLRS